MVFFMSVCFYQEEHDYHFFPSTSLFFSLVTKRRDVTEAEEVTSSKASFMQCRTHFLSLNDQKTPNCHGAFWSVLWPPGDFFSYTVYVLCGWF